MIIYKLDETTGRASDLRRVREDYQLANDEHTYEGEGWPRIEQLHGLGYMKREKKHQARGMAHRAILERYPEERQRNMTARALELLAQAQVDGLPLGKAEVDELTAIRAAWQEIDGLRTASNAIEAEIDQLNDREQLERFDPGEANWKQ